MASPPSGEPDVPTLNFKGKVFVENHHLAVPYHELVPVKSKGLSKTASLHDNLIVHGDNLAALKALMPTYHGKVKCIAIDPPYNTGNEGWAYNDRVNSPMMKDWFGKVVDREDLTRHDKWCCMMMPRLKLLRDLLADDGAIFITIDDNEVHRLRFLMDEVFGEENFVATVIWEKVYSPKSSSKYFSENHDFIVIYARSKERFRPVLLPRTDEANAALLESRRRPSRSLEAKRPIGEKSVQQRSLLNSVPGGSNGRWASAWKLLALFNREILGTGQRQSNLVGSRPKSNSSD